MDRVQVDDAQIEFEVRGIGEPVLLIETGLVADGLGGPLLAQAELASRYRLIHYHRRGYMGSTLGSEPLTIDRQARDAAILLRHLGVRSAHVAGHSIGGTIALQLALDEPELVHSLALLEAVVPQPGGKASLQRTLQPLFAAYRSGNKREAVQVFSEGVFGPGWQAVVEKAIPGSMDQAVIDLDTFVRELQGLPEWRFGPEEAKAIKQPVLSVLGVKGDEFMKMGRMQLHSLLPQTEDFDVQSTHLLQLIDPGAVAHGLGQFFARHPIAAVVSDRALSL